MSRRELLLRANPEYLPSIEESFRRCSPGSGKSSESLSPYWDHQRSLAGLEIIDRERGLVRIRGESGFYFPGRSYSALEWVNTLDRLAWLAVSGWQVQAAPVDPAALAFSIPHGRQGFTHPGYAIGLRHTAYDYLRAQYHLACVTPHLPGDICSGARRLVSIEIGPGTGLLALAIKQHLPNSALVLVDLPEMLVFSSIFLTMVLPGKRFLFLDGFERNPDSWPECDFTLLTPDAARRLPSAAFNLAWNTDSMQEMELAAIRGYFALLRRLLHAPAFFYSSNRVEKWIGGGSTRLADYPYAVGDRDVFSRENAFMHDRWIWKQFHYRVPYPWREPRRGGEVMIQKLTEMKTASGINSL